MRIVAGSGVVYALWIYTGGGSDAVHLSWAPSGSTSFQTVTEIPIDAADFGSAHALSAVLGGDGTLHVVFQASEGEGYGTANEECFYMKRPSGGSFSTPVDFTRSPGPSQAPAITLDNSGAPVIVWSEQFGGGQDVFFTHP